MRYSYQSLIFYSIFYILFINNRFFINDRFFNNSLGSFMSRITLLEMYLDLFLIIYWLIYSLFIINISWFFYSNMFMSLLINRFLSNGSFGMNLIGLILILYSHIFSLSNRLYVDSIDILSGWWWIIRIFDIGGSVGGSLDGWKSSLDSLRGNNIDSLYSSLDLRNNSSSMIDSISLYIYIFVYTLMSLSGFSLNGIFIDDFIRLIDVLRNNIFPNDIDSRFNYYSLYSRLNNLIMNDFRRSHYSLCNDLRFGM